MEWKLLLSDERPGITRAQASKKDGRSQFQKDFDRVVFSPAFRRLQDKTQVFPLPESDFVHTRLTHSLEVSVVGRSLGNLVGEKVIERNQSLQNELTKFHFGEIVAAACLAHDIGNPPFGHPGEDAIADYFKNGNGKKYKSEVSDVKKWNDLIKYEGNAQGFRIITKLQNPDLNGGLRLTFATLAAFTKYPNESFIAKREVEVKKFGFFQAEKDIFKKIAESCSLDCKKHKDYYWWCRHPLTFLVEAADDICYRIMDLEDGYRLGLVSFNETEELLLPLLTDKKLAGYKTRDEREKIGFLRAKAISDLVKDLAAAFLENEKSILNGKLDKELISIIKKSKPLQEIYSQSISKIYRSRVVVEREVAGYEVLGGLLDTFINAFNQYVEGDLSPRNRSVINLLPSRLIAAPDVKQLELYERLLRIIDFISGMTDSFAVSLFRKIKGISLPGGRVTE